MRIFYYVIVLLFIVCLKCAYFQFVPPNPCPNLFQYLQNNGIVYGSLQFPNDLSGYYELTVNMSLATLLPDNQNIRLELRTSATELVAGSPVAYNVYFPIQDILPRPTRIQFNGRVYCVGPAEQIGPGRGVTNMWATAYFRVTTSSRPTRPNSVYDEFETIPINTPRPLPVNTPAQFPVNTPAGFPVNTPSRFPVNTPSRFPVNTPPSPENTPPSPVNTPPSPANTPPSPANTPSSRGPFTVTATATPTPFTSPSRSTTPTSAPTSSVTTSGSSNSDLQCGTSMSIQPLIVNGAAVEEGEYPWMAAIMYFNRKTSDYQYGCTGSLITNRHVITAAHCVWFYNAPLLPLEEMSVVFGKVSLTNWAYRGVIGNIQNVTAHTNYKMNKGDADIAVITLQQPVQFQTSIQPVCLWLGDDDLDKIVEREGTVAGWGRDESGQASLEAKKVRMPIVSQVTCLRSDPDFADLTSNRTFCAGKLNGSGPCTGDSGAGFVMRRNGRWTIRGVVALALKDASGTCSVNKYTVFADLAKFGSWLKSALT